MRADTFAICYLNVRLYIFFVYLIRECMLSITIFFSFSKISPSKKIITIHFFKSLTAIKIRKPCYG